ncbi:GNAT family N-acetyltransferase [Wolbachia endosymbiont (group E) of Neria commutata]|uniref:GNAT family N-acetyltransferase n=1 Tax=Wolbachia endosymbiont (group E) of Neria commutata TaxID=3066149 RepID=UPI003132AD03
MIEKIEQNIFGHFKYLPEAAKFSVKTDQDLTIINCGLGSSMFNIVCGIPIEQDNFNRTIQNVINEFKGQPFAWSISPSALSEVLSKKLLECGFIIEATEHAMLCDLTNYEDNKYDTNQLRIAQVLNSRQLTHFIQVIELYDVTACDFYEKFEEPMLNKQEKLFVGYENDVPVIISILFSHNDTAGIFSLITQENKRCLGYGTQMMIYLMNTAKRNGARYVTLSASSDSGYRIYERLGFQTFGQFECFEWKG